MCSANPSTPSGYPERDLRRVLRERQKARTAHSCLPCRERKVRCNKGRPCLTCIKRDHADLCSYAVSPENVSRKKNQNNDDGNVLPPESVTASEGIESQPSPTSLLEGSPLMAVAKEHASQDIPITSHDSSCNARAGFMPADALQYAAIPLLGAEDTENEGNPENTRDEDLSACFKTLPSDQELQSLFSVYRAWVHPFQPVLQNIEAVESELCSIISERALRGDSSFQERDVLRSQHFLCILHAVLASGAQFSDLPTSMRHSLVKRHGTCAFRMLQACNYVLSPFPEGVSALIILGHVLQNSGHPQAAWILGGSTIRMAVGLGIHTIGVDGRTGDNNSAISVKLARHLRLSLLWQDTLLSLAFNRPVASQEMDFEDDLQPLQDLALSVDSGLTYSNAMNWLCHCSIKHWPPYGSLDLSRFWGFCGDVDALQGSLCGHLQNLQNCQTIQQLQEFYGWELHRNFSVSAFCRPALSKRSIDGINEGEVQKVRERLQRSLKCSVRAFIRLRSLGGYAARAWPFVHNGLTSALLLGFLKETRNEEESRQIQDELIQSLETINNSSHTTAGLQGFPHHMTDAHKKSLQALKALRKIAQEEQDQLPASNTRVDSANSGIDVVGNRDTIPSASIESTVEDSGLSDFSQLFRTFDMDDAFPLDAFDCITSDPFLDSTCSYGGFPFQ